MHNKSVEADLLRRIDETRSWLQCGENTDIDGLEARNTPCTATAIDLIDDPGRKESDGVRFRLEFGPPDRRYESLVEVRIKATTSATTAESIEGGNPYVAVYVLEMQSNTGLLGYYDRFDNPELYLRSADDSIEEWYAKWLRRLLQQRTGNIIFKHKSSI